MFILRYILVGGAAVAVTTVLFYVMHLLITHGMDDDRDPPPPLKNIDLVRLKSESAAEILANIQIDPAHPHSRFGTFFGGRADQRSAGLLVEVFSDRRHFGKEGSIVEFEGG